MVRLVCIVMYIVTTLACYPYSFNSNSLKKLSSHDAQILLNVLYYSYIRSSITLNTQKEALASLASHWDIWHNCAIRRLDPNTNSTTISHISVSSCTNFLECVKKYHTIHTLYAQLITHATSRDSYEDQETFELVHAIREEVRVKVLEKMRTILVNIKDEIEKLLVPQYTNLRSTDSYLNNIITQSNIIELHYKRYGLLSSILNQLAMGSFTEFNNNFTEKTNLLFHSFLEAQEHFNRLWKTIETARKDYYAEKYRILYEIMQKNEFQKISFYSIVEPNELLPVPSISTNSAT